MEQPAYDVFFSRHRLFERSEARSVYDSLKNPPSDQSISEKEREQIAAQDKIDKLLIWLRCKLSPAQNQVLCEKLLTFEDAVMPMLIPFLQITSNKHLLNNSLYLLIHCKMDYCPWLMEHLHQIRDPYAQSILCLVLGFRGNQHAASFLMYQVEHLKRSRIDDSLQQAPLLALHELKSRFPAI